MDSEYSVCDERVNCILTIATRYIFPGLSCWGRTPPVLEGIQPKIPERHGNIGPGPPLRNIFAIAAKSETTLARVT